MDKRGKTRREKIKEIVIILKEIKNKNILIDKKKFVFEVMIKYDCSKRIAREYIEVAESILNY